MSKSSRALLEAHVTNLDDQVYAIVGLEGLVGAVMARYSRAETGLRETLLREFIQEDKLRIDKADKLIERVLIAYGDDSVGELEGAHLALEDISMLATKVIEHRRIGGSPIEKSTRYVRFDQRDSHGAYRYVVPKALPPEFKSRYVEVMDGIFDAYTAMWQPIHTYLQTLKPLDAAVYPFKGEARTLSDCKTPRSRKQFKLTYENDLKTKTCDVLRSFLPLATKANVGLFGNGRYYQHLISKMMTSPLVEVQELGEKSLRELSKVIPHYVKRARVLEYAIENEQATRTLVRNLFPHDPVSTSEEVTRIEGDFNAVANALATIKSGSKGDYLKGLIHQQKENEFLTALVYSHTTLPFSDLQRRVSELSDEEKDRCYRACYGTRKTRRDRPERCIEWGYPHRFELVTEWAVYKDLMRHRMGTALIQPLVPCHGFEMPPECEPAGVGKMATDTVKAAEQLFRELPEDFREYAFLHGHKMRWVLGMNDRALMHMLELRTTPQGHPNYRRVSQKIHAKMADAFPKRAAEMCFVNHEPVFWSRADSEARQRDKEDVLES